MTARIIDGRDAGETRLSPPNSNPRRGIFYGRRRLGLSSAVISVLKLSANSSTLIFSSLYFQRLTYQS